MADVRIVSRIRVRAERFKRHPNLLVRRAAQLAILMCLVARLMPWSSRRPAEATQRFEASELIDNPSFSLGVRDYLQSSGLLRPKLGMLARLLIALEAADASERELAGSDHRGFVLRLEGGPDQRALRNLLIWQNLVLGVHPGCGDDRAVDVLLLLSDPAGDAARTFDLVSIALLLPRIRNLALFWDADSLEAALPLHLSVAERAR